MSDYLQSFYRGRSEAAIIRDRERTALKQQLVTLADNLTDSTYTFNAATQCARRLLIFYQNPIVHVNDDILVNEFCELLLGPHETHIRIVTYCLLETHTLLALKTFFSNLSADVDPVNINDAIRILISVAECKPPYEYPQSNIQRLQQPAQRKFSQFHYNATMPEMTESNTPLRLSRNTITEMITLNILPIHFLFDWIPESATLRLLAELPFAGVVNLIIKMYEDNDCESSFDPETATGLLMNITHMGNVELDQYFDGILVSSHPYTCRVAYGVLIDQVQYARCIQLLFASLPTNYLFDASKEGSYNITMSIDSDSDSDEDVQLEDTQPEIRADQSVRKRLESLYDLEKLNSLVNRFMGMATSTEEEPMKLVGPITSLLNTLMIRFTGKKDSILNILLYHRWSPSSQNAAPTYLAQILWQSWCSTAEAAIFDHQYGMIYRLGAAIATIIDATVAENWSTLYLLCEMYTRLLLTIGDDEFFSKSNSNNQLELNQVITLSRHLKNISFVLFWRANSIGMDDMLGLTGIGVGQLRTTVTNLLQQIHMRDSRRMFCPKDHWLIDGLTTEGFASEVVAEEFSLESNSSEHEQRRQPSRSKLAVISPRLGLLNNIPFVIPFEHRVEIFRMLVENNRRNYDTGFSFLNRSAITIRRDHVFEDSFNHLYKLGAGLKRRVSITFMDEFGMHEAGIDGGGVFKEFLTCLGHEAFDTNYGLFIATADQLLYPNPSPYATEGTQLAYFEFVGLMIGKALYEDILLDVAFAEFFLKKCLGRVNYLDDLPSLDPELYKGLITVKNFPGNVEDLCLDFTLTENEFGQSRTVELIPGGGNIPVTNQNRIRYVYLVANYRLNVQIAKQCKAFYKGLSTIIDVKWLRMFNQQELQVVLGGASVPIDINDLRKHTVYAGYMEHDDTVKYFWKALDSFDNEQRMKFVKFVTSCSRPPLLGFKELRPRLCIRNAGPDNERLPTSSTCVNLLKLPRFNDYNILREKLLYAINAEAGFDLS
ncbi:hypothetical protein DFQ30_004502 [Apophysomyces sp. BC1015]|nr:hypothetical protein DFQ30_004502 [Apophysomyces sp. BC1015]